MGYSAAHRLQTQQLCLVTLRAAGTKDWEGCCSLELSCCNEHLHVKLLEKKKLSCETHFRFQCYFIKRERTVCSCPVQPAGPGWYAAVWSSPWLCPKRAAPAARSLWLCAKTGILGVWDREGFIFFIELPQKTCAAPEVT